MMADDLELLSTQELVAELMRRTTFQGVVIHAIGGTKDRHWDGERVFAVHHNTNLDTEEAGRLLDVVSQYIAARE